MTCQAPRPNRASGKIQMVLPTLVPYWITLNDCCSRWLGITAMAGMAQAAMESGNSESEAR